MELLYTSQEKVMVPNGKLTEFHILKVKEQSKFGQVAIYKGRHWHIFCSMQRVEELGVKIEIIIHNDHEEDPNQSSCIAISEIERGRQRQSCP
ncbi:hypothetical protein ACET3Z_009988 [Daucus carota]